MRYLEPVEVLIDNLYNSPQKRAFLETIITTTKNNILKFLRDTTPSEIRRNKDISEFTAEELQQVLIDLHYQSDKTYMNYTGCICKYAKWCYENQLITILQYNEFNKFRKMGIPAEAMRNKSYYYSDEDLERRSKLLYMYGKYDERYYCWTLVTYWLIFKQLTMMDVLQIKCSDVDLKKRTVTVNRFDYEGRKGGVVKEEWRHEVLHIPDCMFRYFELLIKSDEYTTPYGTFNVPPHEYLVYCRDRRNHDYHRQGKDIYESVRLLKRIVDRLQTADVTLPEIVDELPNFDLIYKSGIFAEVNKSLLQTENPDCIVDCCSKDDIRRCSVRVYDAKDREPQRLRDEYSYWAINCKQRMEEFRCETCQ